MKKRISQVLAIVLTIALLASTFVMLGMPTVSANDTAVKTEHIVVDGKSYKILSDSKYSAYDSLAADIANATAGETYAEAPEMTFSGAWKVEGTKPDGTEGVAKLYVNAGNSWSPAYKQISLGAQGEVFTSGIFSASLVQGRIYVDPSWHSATNSETHKSSVSLTFTAPKAGNVLLYDLTEAISSTTKDVVPFYSWSAEGHTTEWAIYVNNTKIWPVDENDVNSVSTIGAMVAFPDAGIIAIEAGQTISIEFKTTGFRHGIYTMPAVAYVAPDAEVGEQTKEVVTSSTGNKYIIDADRKYDAYSTFKSYVSGLNAADNSPVSFTGAWDMSSRGRLTVPFDCTHSTSVTLTEYVKTPSYRVNSHGACNRIMGGTANSGGWYCSSVSLDDTNKNIVVSAYDSTSSETDSSQIRLNVYAEHDGKVVLFDTTNKFDASGFNSSPWWANQSESKNTQLEIYHNGNKIWPSEADGEQTVGLNNTSVSFPDLGALNVNKGDYFSFVFTANANNVRVAVRCNPTMAYVFDGRFDVEDKIIGNERITVESETVSNAYDAFCGLVAGKSPIAYPADNSAFESAPIISFDNSAWRAVYKRSTTTYTNAAYTTSNGSSANAVPQLSFTKDKRWYDYVQGGIAFDPTYGMVINPGNSWEEARDMRVNYNVTADGTIALYDTDGKFITLPNQNPYWCWANANAFVDVNVYKNDVLVWPLNGEDNRVNQGEKFSFPVIELDVVKGDVISVSFSNNIAVAARTPVSVDLEVAYTHEHDENVVVTAGTHYIPGKRNGTCTLCGNTYTDAPVINAEPAVTLDENSVKYDPATDKFSFKVYYSEGLMRDYDASVEQELGPTFTLKYKIGEKVKNVTIDPTEYIGHTIEFNGFNSSTLDETFTISFHMAWDGKDDGTGTWVSYVKKEDGSWRWTDAYEVFTFVPSNYIASDNADLVNSFNTLKNEIAAAESEAAKVVADRPSNSDYRINKAEVNIKEGKAIISVAVTEELKNKVKANADYDAGRTAKYVLTIGGVEYPVPTDKLYTSATFTISGLSYSQMFGQISAKIVVTYTDANAQPIESTAITCDFAAAIDAASDNTVANALASYMNSK
ncbi:MAG: hypothetical protein J6C27_02260 [Clostridia bacterium]|nr:hypothetical protein [Clostridia bacterium]